MGSISENCLGWAARDTSGVLSPYNFIRRDTGPDDVSLTITHCGICYADVAWAKNIPRNTIYPVVPGHEIVGIVREVGSNVRRFKVGDHVGVGPYVNSCKTCEHCKIREEVHCDAETTHTFNSVDEDGTITRGGYSSYIVVQEGYVFKIPDNYSLISAAPLLCAGITVYAPMMRHKMNEPGKSLGVIGLGGLGHLAVKFGKAFGLHVTVFSTSNSKKDEALNLLGADKFIISSDMQQMESSAKSLDFIIDTASGDHPFDPYMALLKPSGVLVLVGFPSEVKFNPMSLLAALVNGRVCKDPKLVQASDFFFTGLHLPGNTSNSFGSKVTPVNVAQLPGLNTLDISMVRIDYAPWGVNAPHTHPRASEILTVLEGTLYVGFVTSNPENRLIAKTLQKGDVFVFPVGLIHFQRNAGYGNAVAIAALSSQNPGVVSVGNAVFGSNPPIASEVLTKSFQVGKNVVDRLQAQFL